MLSRSFLLAFLALALLAAPALGLSDPGKRLPGEGSACTSGASRGTCTAGACSGQSVTERCPGPVQVKCCIPAPTPAPAPSQAQVQGEGASCMVGANAGTCTAGACNGQSVAGKCPGPAQVKCCVNTAGSSTPAPAPAPTPAPTPAPAPDVVLPGEGTICLVGTQRGSCTAGSCAGQLVAGKCPGSVAIKCCLPPAVAQPPPGPGMPMVPAGVSLLPGTPIQMWSYRFPYSQGRYLALDFALQKLRLYDGSNMLKEYKVSTGKLGLGSTPNRANTPWGKMRVAMKVGTRQPLGMVIEKLTPQGKIGKESDKYAYMQTRILVLEGLEAHNRNTRARSIYIHGTNRESRLGRPDSAGCIRMGNREVMELYDLVQTGVELYALPYAAWP